MFRVPDESETHDVTFHRMADLNEEFKKKTAEKIKSEKENYEEETIDECLHYQFKHMQCCSCGGHYEGNAYVYRVGYKTGGKGVKSGMAPKNDKNICRHAVCVDCAESEKPPKCTFCNVKFFSWCEVYHSDLYRDLMDSLFLYGKKCPDCDWYYTLDLNDDHAKNCGTVECSGCKESIKKKHLDDHRLSCLAFLRKFFNTHKDSTAKNIALKRKHDDEMNEARKELKQMEETLIDVQKTVEENDHLHEKISTLEKQVKELTGQLKEMTEERDRSVLAMERLQQENTLLENMDSHARKVIQKSGFPEDAFETVVLKEDGSVYGIDGKITEWDGSQTPDISVEYAHGVVSMED